VIESRHTDTQRDLALSLPGVYGLQISLKSGRYRSFAVPGCFDCENGKLITSQAGDDIGVSERLFQCFSRSPERSIAFGMTERIID
jgi:hypothetical protein